jgi:predicted ATPase
MKLIRLKIDADFRSLHKGFEVRFLRDEDKEKIWEFAPYCLVGRNGSGKSNILEVLAAIFYHIECIYLDYKPEGFEGDGAFNRVHTEGFFPESCTPDVFELEYYAYKKGVFSSTFSEAFQTDEMLRILIKKEGKKSPQIFTLNEEGAIEQELSRTEVKEVLPEFVIGYSSGENEILSLPFFKMRFIQYDEYEDALRNETPYANPEGRLMYLDTQHSQAVFLTNFLMQDEKVLQPLYDTIGFKSINSFRIIIGQHKRITKEKLEYDDFFEREEAHQEPRDTFELTELLVQKNEDTTDIKVIDKLKRCATTQYFDKATNTLYLDYFVDEDARDGNGNILQDEQGEQVGLSQMKQAFRAHFNNDPFELFRAFQILLTLNLYDVDIKTKREVYSSNSMYVNETIPVLPSHKRIFRFKDFIIEKANVADELLSKSLSDGEHQYLHAIGLCLLFRRKNALFLLDEPETHFNPDWRARFISTLRDCLIQTSNEKTALREILITSHSPFIISDSQEENVLVFKKNPADEIVSMDRPGFKTFGASVNLITIKLFNRVDTIGDLANEKVLEFEKRIETENNLETLKEEIFNTIGESVERTMLINQLINKRDNK